MRAVTENSWPLLIVKLDSVAPVLASDTAALSLTNGLPGILVGAMTAVALLPSAASPDLMLGRGRLGPIIGAGLLLGLPVVCLNLALKLVFLLKAIPHRTRWAKRKGQARPGALSFRLVSDPADPGTAHIGRRLLP